MAWADPAGSEDLAVVLAACADSGSVHFAMATKIALLCLFEKESNVMIVADWRGGKELSEFERQRLLSQY